MSHLNQNIDNIFILEYHLQIVYFIPTLIIYIFKIKGIVKEYYLSIYGIHASRSFHDDKLT
jgi:hypothetical protein